MRDVFPCPINPNYGVTLDARVFRIVRYRFGPEVPFEMKQRLDINGYLVLTNGWRVNRLMASAFIPNPGNLPQVAHWDGVRTNNSVGNLRWVTSLENHGDMRRHGTVLKGKDVAAAKLTEEQVRDARRRAAAGESHASIAEGLPVDRSVLSRAIRRDTWSHVT